jgi:uncharacterized phage protein (TIGR01671 family)
MREIKFRAWSKDENKMLEPETLRYLVNLRPMSDEFSGKEWMQFTGLKDKNGKEIYEGDIVESSDKEIGVVFWEQETTSYVLSQSDDIDDNHWSGLQEGGWEVIGNTWENPELLK